MVFPSHGNNFLRESTLGNIFWICKDIGMIPSRKRHESSLREANKEVVRRTCPLSVIQARTNERVLERRVIVMEDHHR
jgi:hypothetical protein